MGGVLHVSIHTFRGVEHVHLVQESLHNQSDYYEMSGVEKKLDIKIMTIPTK